MGHFWDAESWNISAAAVCHWLTFYTPFGLVSVLRPFDFAEGDVKFTSDSIGNTGPFMVAMGPGYFLYYYAIMCLPPVYGISHGSRA